MTLQEARQLEHTINDTPYQPKTDGWIAGVKLVAQQQPDGVFDGRWAVILTHITDERAFVLFSEQEWQFFQERDDEH